MTENAGGSDAGLIDEIVGRQRRRAASEAENAAAMVEFVDRCRAAGQQCAGGGAAGELEAKYAADELALATTTPTGTVERLLARTRRVRPRLPGVWELWCEGLIDGYKVSKIDEAAQRLVYGDSLVTLDTEVVKVAPGKTASQLQEWLNRFVARTEPAEATQRYRRAFGDRTVYTSPDSDGMGWLNVCHHGLDLAQVDARLEHMARALGADDPRTMDQRKADLAVDLLLGRIADSTDGTVAAAYPDSTGDAPGATDSRKSADNDSAKKAPVRTPGASPSTTIGVVVPVQTLTGDADVPGQTLDGEHVVPVDLIRERAAQPGTLFYKLLTDEVGNLLAVTEAGRYPSHKLGFAIRARDGTSRFPTSTTPADRCDLDHTVPHSDRPNDGGPTSAANLGPLHRRIHNAKTAGLLHLRQPDPGRFEWVTSTGHRYTTEAEPLPVAQWLAKADLPLYRPEDYIPAENLDPEDPALDDLRNLELCADLPDDPEPDWHNIAW